VGRKPEVVRIDTPGHSTLTDIFHQHSNAVEDLRCICSCVALQEIGIVFGAEFDKLASHADIRVKVVAKTDSSSSPPCLPHRGNEAVEGRFELQFGLRCLDLAIAQVQTTKRDFSGGWRGSLRETCGQQRTETVSISDLLGDGGAEYESGGTETYTYRERGKNSIRTHASRPCCSKTQKTFRHHALPQ